MKSRVPVCQHPVFLLDTFLCWLVYRVFSPLRRFWRGEGLFCGWVHGEAIKTPSMLCVADHLRIPGAAGRATRRPSKARNGPPPDIVGWLKSPLYGRCASLTMPFPELAPLRFIQRGVRLRGAATGGKSLPLPFLSLLQTTFCSLGRIVQLMTTAKGIHKNPL